METIKNSASSYKIIPKEGCQIQLLGKDTDDIGLYSKNYYLVIGELSQLAIAISYQESHCEGAKAIQVNQVPNYLLVKFRSEVLVGQN